MTLIWRTILMHSACAIQSKTQLTATLQTTCICTSRTIPYNSIQQQNLRVQPLWQSDCARKPQPILAERPPWDRACNTKVQISLWLALPQRIMVNHSPTSKDVCPPNKTSWIVKGAMCLHKLQLRLGSSCWICKASWILMPKALDWAEAVSILRKISKILWQIRTVFTKHWPRPPQLLIH